MVEVIDDDFERWFRSTRVRVQRAAHQLLGSEADADDIVAEAFARALMRWPTVRDHPHRDAWVLRVASNLAIDALRRRSRRERILVVHRAAEALPDTADGSVERIAVALAVGRLPRRQREVITLRYLIGLSDAEVAGALGMSTNTVKTHAGRALGSLRKSLGSGWEESSIAY